MHYAVQQYWREASSTTRDDLDSSLGRANLVQDAVSPAGENDDIDHALAQAAINN